jgi:hypothetical protein
MDRIFSSKRSPSRRLLERLEFCLADSLRDRASKLHDRDGRAPMGPQLPTSAPARYLVGAAPLWREGLFIHTFVATVFSHEA